MVSGSSYSSRLTNWYSFVLHIVLLLTTTACIFVFLLDNITAGFFFLYPTLPVREVEANASAGGRVVPGLARKVNERAI